MSNSNADFDSYFPALEPDQPPPRRRSWAWLAWLVIVGIAAFMIFGRTPAEDREGPALKEDRVGELLMKLQARYLVGAEDLLHQNKAIFESAKMFRKGPVDQRLRFVILTGELAGPGEALKQLDILHQELINRGIKITPEQAKLRDLLTRLYQDYQRGRLKPSLSTKEMAYLRQHLNWFGELALTPAGLDMDEDSIAAAAGPMAALALANARVPNEEARTAVLEPARRTFGVIIGGVTLMILAGLAGFIGLVVFIALALAGKVRSGVHTGTGHGGIYAETFALWLALFSGLLMSAPFIPLDVPPLLLSSGLMLLSLLALGWPVFRGIPWSVVREEIGLSAGRNPPLEPVIGVACYAMAIPLLALGVIATLILLQVQRSFAGAGDPFAPTSFPSHPIFETLARGGLAEKLLVIFLASVVAPIVEETMFRGVLYRHLREVSARFGPVLSMLASATVVSFLFAAIHPQGLVAVPILMALAYGFALAREWRGTLVPGMVGHALNNALVTILFLTLAD